MYCNLILFSGSNEMENICSEETSYIYPKFGRNITGDFLNILNTAETRQMVQVKTCIRPWQTCGTGGLFYGLFDTYCLQDYVKHILVRGITFETLMKICFGWNELATIYMNIFRSMRANRWVYLNSCILVLYPNHFIKMLGSKLLKIFLKRVP